MLEKIDLDWKKYEVIVKYIYECLGKESGVIIEGYGNSCKVTGKSGVEHQIDVLTNHSDGIHTYKTAIECKFWESKINKDIVMKVSEIIKDSGINKGVIVSKQGFTPDGISYAKYNNIGLVELREVNENDKENKGRILDFQSWILRPEILSITIENIDKNPKPTEEVKIDEIFIEIKNEEVPFTKYINEFKKELSNQKTNSIFTKAYNYENAELINKSTGYRISIKGFKIIGTLRKLDSKLKFYPVDQVWLIMKSIFEESTFVISSNGKITKQNN